LGFFIALNFGLANGMHPRQTIVTKPLQKYGAFHTETIHALGIMGLNQGEEDGRMSATDTETLIILIVTWLPMLWFSRPPKRHS